MSGLGSRSSSRSMTARSRRSVPSASDCRPDWYCAVASSTQRRSRTGASAISACALSSTRSCCPARSAASTYSSSAVCRSSVSRAASIRAGSQPLQLAQRPAPPQGQRVRENQRRPLRVAGGQQVGGRYGDRKMYPAFNRQLRPGVVSVGRDQVARLMRPAGLGRVPQRVGGPRRPGRSW
jgi:hypothetical protein